MGKVAKDFKQFLLRGNVVDLAVAVVIGSAFGAMISSFVKDIITPLIAAIVGKPDFSRFFFTIHNSQFMYGDFINAVVSFLLIATVIFFFIVLPINTLVSKARKQPPADPTTRKCPYCISVVPIDARRCAYCTSELHPVKQQRKSGVKK